MKYRNGDKYTGGWKDNVEHGQGTYEYISGNVYEGEFNEGEMTGKGVLTYDSGMVFEGEFAQGQIADGEGVLTWPPQPVEEAGEESDDGEDDEEGAAQARYIEKCKQLVEETKDDEGNPLYEMVYEDEEE